MSFHSWLQNLRSVLGTNRSQRCQRERTINRAAMLRPNLEVLEDRCVPALYAITQLSTLGGYSSYGADLNQVGQVVGSSDTWDGFYHACLWDNGAIIDLGTLGGTSSWAEGVNDLGQVVGSSYLPGDESRHAFLVDPKEGSWFQDNDLDGRNDFMIDLGALDGSDYSWASDINNAGQVVGESFTADGFIRGFLWDAESGMADLGTPSGFFTSSANAINELGQAVVGAAYYADSVWHYGAFLWDAANGMVALGAGPGYTDSPATDIDDAGQVVGYQWGAPYGNSAAFLWTPDSPNGQAGSFNDLGVFPGGIDSRATAINNAGQVVGSGAASDGWGRAFLWDPVNGMVDLNNHLPSGSEVYLEVAQAINDDGAIVANGSNGWDYTDGYLLTPIHGITLTIADAPTVTEGNAGTRAAAFTVTLSEASNQDVTVTYVTADGTAQAGSDYAAVSNGTLTIPAGLTSGTITVLVNGDRLGELNETFFVNLSSPTNATIADDQGVGTIIDDEPRISISDVSKSEGRKGKTTLFTFTVKLSAAYDQAVTMSYRTVNGTATTSASDYIAKTGTLTFAPGETTKTVTIEVKGDSKKEANETFYLDLFGPSNALFTKSRGVGTILNDD